MKKHIIAMVVLIILWGCQSALAKTDTIPLTAKKAWGIVAKQLESKYGSALLYQLQPVSNNISSNDTSLFLKGKNFWGGDSLFWKGNAYEWFIRCGYEGLAFDSVLYINVSVQIGKPANIVERSIPKLSAYSLHPFLYKAIPDTVWIDSDVFSLKMSQSMRSPLVIFETLPLTISLQYTSMAKNLDTNLVWIHSDFSTLFGLMSWDYFEGETGTYITTTAVSVEETQADDGTDRVYPNPSVSTFNLSKEYSYESVQIANTMGEVVATWLNTEPSKVFNTEGIPGGVYILRTSRSGKQYSQPLVISR